jgi:hypothetical protein
MQDELSELRDWPSGWRATMANSATCRICGQTPEHCACIDDNPSRLSHDALLLRCRCTRAVLREAERERDEYRTLAKQYRDDWQSEIDGNAALRRELGAHDNETFPAFARRLAGEATGYRKLAAELARALATVQTLMQESRGVDGLHRNGDVADWDWLVDYDWMPDINSLLDREDVRALLKEDGDAK